MARSLRQSKILELISNQEIEKQEELVALLRAADFDVTQATVSRDIKELGLIKVLSDSKKYKYVYVETAGDQNTSNRYINIFKESFINISIVGNMVFLKTIKGLACAVDSFLDKLGINDMIGSTFGNDTITIYFQDVSKAIAAGNIINKLVYC